MKHKFEDDCPGCRPVIIDQATMRVFPPDSPVMKAAMKVWAATTREEREAFHRVTCLNSRDPEDFAVMHRIGRAVAAAAEIDIRTRN